MDNSRFSPFEAIVYAFKTVLDNFRLFFMAGLAKLLTFLVFFLIALLSSFSIIKNIWNLLPKAADLFKCTSMEACKAAFEQLREPLYAIMVKYSIVMSVFVVLLIFLAIGIYLGFIRLVLRLHDTGSSSVRLLFSCFGLVPKALISTILYLLMVSVGFALFIIPGIYFMLRGLFFPYFMVDKNAGIIGSLKGSFNATCGQVWNLFALTIFIYMILFIPAVMIFIAPIMTVAYSYVYRKLTI